MKITRGRVLAGIDAWHIIGFGVDPQQIAFRHYAGDSDCECFTCRPGRHPVVETFAGGGSIEYFEVGE